MRITHICDRADMRRQVHVLLSVSGTLGVVRRELGDTQAENAVLKVCLERAVSSSSGAVDVEVGRERE